MVPRLGTTFLQGTHLPRRSCLDHADAVFSRADNLIDPTRRDFNVFLHCFFPVGDISFSPVPRPCNRKWQQCAIQHPYIDFASLRSNLLLPAPTGGCE